MIKLLLLASLFTGFQNPPEAAKPWTYWWWVNGRVDKKTITADLEAMKKLGFGGLLMFDSRGYWDDERHVVNPKPKYDFMSPEWQDHVVFAINEAARLGLKFTMNMSSSGGKLDGPWSVGADAPKRLVYRYEEGEGVKGLKGGGVKGLKGEGVKGLKGEGENGLRFYRDVDVQEVWYVGEEIKVDGVWRNGGEGVFLDGFRSRKRESVEAAKPRMRVKAGTPGAKRIRVRFGYAVLDGHDHDVDVLDPKAVAGHFDRFQGALQAKIPGLVGRDKTLSALYSVSWEGSMPTWTGDFENEFRRFTGLEVRPNLAYLAGFTDDGREAFMTAYRRARNDMFRENFYGTMRDLAHARNLDWYSESGGPWGRQPHLFREADQLEFLAVNDFPQGEFWPVREKFDGKDGGLENANGRYHVRGAVSCAHIYGKKIAAAEAFTHMHRHWSVDPAFLKPLGDIAFADGVNRLVWHTFTCSPDEFGAPGAEYFAGSHINRNVTWHDELAPFISYIARCQYLLQAGEPVVDIAVLGGSRTYPGSWGRFRDRVADAKAEPHLDAKIRPGYAYDLVNDDALAKNPDLLKRYPVVFDLRKGENLGKTVPTGKLAPDVQTFTPNITWCHRRVGGVADIYFLTGAGDLTSTNGWVTFRSVAPQVEIWDPLTATRRVVTQAKRTGDGRTGLQLAMPQGGSVFVVFLKKVSEFRGFGVSKSQGGKNSEKSETCRDEKTSPLFSEPRMTFGVGTEWDISFAYHPAISARPPKAMHVGALFDFTTREETKHFAGTATYRTVFEFNTKVEKGDVRLSLGEVKSGLAHVYLNGKDCGTAWCRPWTVDVTDAIRPGRNVLEIRYTNNWYNRLVGDCLLPEEKRVTKSTVRYWNVPRAKSDPKRPWELQPTVFSGPSAFDALQPSGLTGPVCLSFRRDALPPVNPCGFGSTSFGNWISLGEEIAFTNSLPAEAAMEGAVYDTKGAEVYRAAAKGNVWTWRPATSGYYTAKFTAVQGGRRKPVEMILRATSWSPSAGTVHLGDFPRTEFGIAVSPAPAREPTDVPAKFGFNVAGWSSPRDLEPMRRTVRLLGMSNFLRLHYYRWDEMEKTPGKIDWKVADYTLKYWREHGYDYDRLLVDIFGTPAWLSTAPADKVGKTWYERPALYAPKDMKPVREFFRQFCARYPGIRNVEVWNEPHLPGYSVFWKDSTPEQFVDLLRNAYQGIKAADPAINVVMGGIGMRYLPFYERVVPLGIVDWYDMMDTHCGYNMRPFRELEKKLGVKSKPYWEGEWHTVLYNCSDPNPPSEEECAFRMLMNFADLLHTVDDRITGFGLNCGTHVPETAKTYAKQGGIQQVCGLFRTVPLREPRFAAFALRTATDLFAGDVRRLGAWRHGEDGRYYAVALGSDRGNVAFLWTAQTNTKRGAVPASVVAAAKGAKVLDWEGHETTLAAFEPRKMYYLVEPDLAALAKGQPVEDFEFYTYNFKGYGTAGRADCGYAPLGTVKPTSVGKAGAAFAADLNADGLKLALTLPRGEKPAKLRVVADAESTGVIEGVVEFAVAADGTIVKHRTPQLRGDIPSDWSPANVPLAKSKATYADGVWRVDFWRGDLFPFACSKGCQLALSFVLTTDRGEYAWGGGLSKIIEPGRFGTLRPSGGGKVLATTADATRVFGDAKLDRADGAVKVTATSGGRGAGFSLPVAYAPGSVIRYRGEVRGNVPRLVVGCWASFGKGTKSERRDGPNLSVEKEWRPFAGEIRLPALSSEGSLNFFTFRNGKAVWEIRNLEVVND